MAETNTEYATHYTVDIHKIVSTPDRYRIEGSFKNLQIVLGVIVKYDSPLAETVREWTITGLPTSARFWFKDGKTIKITNVIFENSPQ